MAYTNAQLLRQLIGDRGTPQRDVASGDAASTEFYIASPPIAGNSQIVKVAGTQLTEVASAPTSVQYTFDDESGRTIFGAAPASGTENIEWTYLSVEVVDADIVEALRQYGLTDSAEAATGLPVAIVQAAILIAESQAAHYATHISYSADGESIDESGIADRWRMQASLLKEKVLIPLTTTSGTLQSMPVTRIDGYSDDIKGRDVQVTSTNSRRKYYGYPDRIP